MRLVPLGIVFNDILVEVAESPHYVGQLQVRFIVHNFFALRTYHMVFSVLEFMAENATALTLDG